MGLIDINNVRLYYEETGEGPETIVFSHSYLLSSEHFRPQVEALSDRYRCVCFDHRGHGRSDKPKSGYELENLYADAVGLIEALGLAPCHFVGLSTGGFIGQRIALRRPELLRSLVLMDTSADAEPAVSTLKYKLMIFVARRLGLWVVTGQAMRSLFGRKFLRDPKRRAEAERWAKVLRANDTDAVARFGLGIFARTGVYEELPRITTPTLVIVGQRDQPTPVSRAARIASQIPGAELRIIPDAGHVCTVEEPAAVNSALETFFRATRVGPR